MNTNDQMTPGPAKPVLVFLHYFGGAAKSWKWLIDELGDGYECLPLDLPGFGGTPPLTEISVGTMADHVITYLDEHLNVDEYILIGHSMGGKIAMEVAYRSRSTNKKVKQLILTAPSPPTVERMPDEEKQRMLIHPDRDEAVITVHNGTVRELTGDKLQTAIETQLVVDEKTWRWWITEGMNRSIAEHANGIEVPVTLIVSSDDPAITQQMTEQETIPNLPQGTKIVWTSGIGHLFQLEDPAWLAEQIKNVIEF